LKSICVPSCVGEISRSCFNCCDTLEHIVLKTGCKLSVASIEYLRSRYHVILQ
jgi:hypothetical protein